MGDLNAKIRKEEVYQQAAGKYTLHESTNSNGEWACEYAIANNMKIVSTYYQRKRIHLGTWTSPDGNTVNQIDHVMVDAKRKGVVEDVRTMRGPNCDSDHFLVKVKIRQKLIRTPINVNKQIKWNQNNPMNTTKLQQYRTCLCNKLNKKGKQQGIEEEWAHIKQTIMEAAKESIQTQNMSTRNEWWDDECRQIITQKK
jgi:hypothetical protein